MQSAAQSAPTMGVSFESESVHVTRNAPLSFSVDCSQSPIFSLDRLDIHVARLTINNGHFNFQMYRGGGRRGL